MTTIKHSYGELLAKLISFDTTSSESNLSLIQWLSTYLRQHQFETHIFYNKDQTKANLVATIGPNVSGGFMLAGHTDVVPVEGQLWDSLPFQLIEKEGNLIGRGTSDMKGFIALICDVIASINLNKLQNPLYLVFTYDEEIGCFGAKALQQELIKFAKNIDFALIGEPTNFSLVNAHKGLQGTQTNFKGIPAHSSCPHLGSSAIMAGAEFLQKLSSVMPANEDPHFNPPITTFNAGTIKGGNALNIIAEHCQLTWECRPLPEVSENQINTALEHLSQKITKNTHVEIDNHIASFVPGLTATDNQKVIQFLKNFLPDNINVTTVPFVTEAGIFEQSSIPTVVFGPGKIEQAHQPNESVAINAMENYRQFLVDLVSHYCH